MGRKILQDVANTLPNILVARMHIVDLETLAHLPDGSLSLNLLAHTARHSLGGDIELKIVDELTDWLKTRLVKNQVAVSDLTKAELVAAIRTDKIPTDRDRIVVFDFSITCNVGLREENVVTAIGTGRTWHDRVLGRQPT